jgi:transcriptional regulator of acetoin/glycerol metabolism
VMAPEAVRAAQKLLAEGWSVREAAAATGVPRSTLHRRLAELRAAAGDEVERSHG